jgi:hypothetical protein
VHAVKAYRGRRGIVPLILKFDSRWRCAVNFTPGVVYLQERSPVLTVLLRVLNKHSGAYQCFYRKLSEWRLNDKKLLEVL